MGPWLGWGMGHGRSGGSTVDRHPALAQYKSRSREAEQQSRSQKKQRSGNEAATKRQRSGNEAATKRQRKTTTWRYMYTRMYTYLFAAGVGVGFGTPSSRRLLSF